MGNGALLSLHSNNDNEWHKCMYGAYGRTLAEELEEQRSERQLDVKQPKESYPGIRIEGAVGMYACHINHPFVRTEKMYNERPLYRSLAEENYWLRYASSGRWMVSSTDDKEDNSCDGFCYCEALGLFEPWQAKRWYVLGAEKFRMQYVLGTEKFRMQTSVKVRAMTSIEIILEGTKIQETLPSVLRFQGAVGILATKINGIYRWKIPRGSAQLQHNKLMFWRQSSSSTHTNRSVLMYDKAQRWVVSQGARVLAYCESTGLSTPCDATRWHVCNLAKKNSFYVLPSVTVTYVHSDKNKDSRDRKSSLPMITSTDNGFIDRSAKHQSSSPKTGSSSSKN